MKDYYRILGLDSEATPDQIRAAYRQAAKDLHPDYYGQDSGPFIDLQEAYAVLSDAARRRAYDEVSARAHRDRTSSGRTRAQPLYSDEPADPEPLIPVQEQADLGDLSLTSSFRTFSPSFEELFDRLRRNYALDRPEFEQLKTLSVEIRLSPGEALRGGRVRIQVPARLTCPTCSGRGGVGLFECWQCNADGFIQGEYPVNLTFPAGVINNYVTEIPLDRLGISNFYLRAIFKVSEER